MAGTLLHVPMVPVTAHDLQTVSHNALQQTPSAQKPLKHSPPAMHEEPVSVLHPPIPSHDLLVPEHVPSSLPMATFEQVPSEPATLQDLQSAVQVVAQQTPSTQCALEH
jgi:hypothetical protein